MGELQVGSLVLQTEISEPEVVKEPLIFVPSSFMVQVEIAEPGTVVKEPFIFGTSSFMLQVEIAEPDILKNFWHVQFI